MKHILNKEMAMVFISDREIDDIIMEDVMYGDLTTSLLDLGGKAGTIRFIARESTVVCGCEEVLRIFTKFGIEAGFSLASGDAVEAGDLILTGTGSAESLHGVWRNCGRLLEHVSGIATRTRALVDAAKRINPLVEVCTTRKCFPGTKKLAVKAVLAGGGVLHRLGLSETVLLFREHISMAGGPGAAQGIIGGMKTRAPEKVIAVEAHTPEEARAYFEAGADIVQCDKLDLEGLAAVAAQARSFPAGKKVSAAGNVNIENIEGVVSTGVDFIVTSSPYFGKPSDIKVELQ